MPRRSTQLARGLCGPAAFCCQIMGWCHKQPCEMVSRVLQRRAARGMNEWTLAEGGDTLRGFSGTLPVSKLLLIITLIANQPVCWTVPWGISLPRLVKSRHNILAALIRQGYLLPSVLQFPTVCCLLRWNTQIMEVSLRVNWSYIKCSFFPPGISSLRSKLRHQLLRLKALHHEC